MLDSNENQNSSPKVTLPTNTTSNQVGAMNKNSIEPEAGQLSQSPLVDSEGGSPGGMGKSSYGCHSTSSGTLSSHMSTRINDIVQIANGGGLRTSSFDKITLDNEGVAAQLQEKEEKITELETQLKAAEEEKIKALEAANKKAEEEKIKALEAANKKAEEEKIKALEAANKKAEEEKAALKAQNNTQEVTNLQQEIENKKKDLHELQQQLKEKDEKITQLKTQNGAAEQKKTDLQNQLTEAEWKNEALNAQNKKIQQLKQGNGARYNATVGVGLAAGLVAFIALERTVRLDIWVMVGIAVVSAAVAGSITYKALPSAQMNGAEVQGVSGEKTNNKG